MKTDEWKWIPGWKGFYKISLSQKVKSVSRVVYRKNRWGGISSCLIPEKILKPVLHKSTGYLLVSLANNGRVETLHIHTLMLNTFVGPCPEGMECRHINDVKTDNRYPENICWGTPKENQSDSRRNGTMRKAKGEDHCRAKLTNTDIRIIRAIFKLRRNKRGVQIELGKRFKVSRQAIQQILKKETWSHVK